MIHIEWCWSHLKIFIFCQVMSKKWRTCPNLSIRFWAITQTFFGQLGWKFLWELRRLLSIDWLSKLWCLFVSFDFWATFGGKMGVATTRASYGLGPPNPVKNLTHWVELLGQSLSWNNVFGAKKGVVNYNMNIFNIKLTSRPNVFLRVQTNISINKIALIKPFERNLAYHMLGQGPAPAVTIHMRQINNRDH